MQPALSVLLVEDETLIALNLQDALEEAGFSVHHVLGGAAAVEVIEAKHAELAAVVTDIRFGRDLDGWQVARRARELSPHIPIVYTSGDSAHEHTAHGVPDSIMLQKPFATAQLVTAIATLLNALPLTT
ncbi:response regulator [Sphingomonas piscis]|uniref:Response regulator n=1 Tax=Sphingomonas piscis TaxID=2714943 RepID=A0A6G7YMB9_9SPHN|nr:response regulator [Sphingomonas piscis]QIK77889.1 response regulator [Sphingomonas piscis]